MVINNEQNKRKISKVKLNIRKNNEIENIILQIYTIKSG